MLEIKEDSNFTVLEVPLAGRERAFCRAFYSLPIPPLVKDEPFDDTDTCLNACLLSRRVA